MLGDDFCNNFLSNFIDHKELRIKDIALVYIVTKGLEKDINKRKSATFTF